MAHQKASKTLYTIIQSTSSTTGFVGEELTLSLQRKRNRSCHVITQPATQNDFRQESHDGSHDTGSERSSPSLSPSHNQQSSVDSPGEISR